MGIRFYCPSGHKLNVKEFLAGKRGICPHCGAKFLIPTQSTRPSSKAKRRKTGAKPPPVASPQHPDALEPAIFPVSQAAGGPGLGRSADAIAEAGGVVWYVRPPSGGQYGPASGEMLRAWLAEGRISGDTLVWHEGWRDWKEAKSLFPQLQQI